MASANYARRRRNAILAAIAMALIFIIIVVLIIVGVSGGNKKDKNTPTIAPSKTTATSTLPTLPPRTDDPTESPVVSDDPTVSGDPTASDETTESDEPTPTPTAPQEAGTVMYVTGDGVNVRESASAESDKITSLSKGTAVTAYNKVGDFYSVKLSDGKLGYISAKYVSKDDPKKTDATPTPKPTATPDTSKGSTKYVTGDSVNVRKSGSSSADKVASLVKGKEVTAYAKVGDWTYIRYGNSKYGYIATKYLSDTDPTKATPTATASPSPTAGATPSPTPITKKSFADLGVAEAVAKLVNGNKAYLNKADGISGADYNGNTDPTKYSYYAISTTDNSGVFYIVYKGTQENPTFAEISETKPTNN